MGNSRGCRGAAGRPVKRSRWVEQSCCRERRSTLASTVMSVFGVDPVRIGGVERFSRELSRQLQERGWGSALCYLSEPSGMVRDFLALPNVVFDTVPGCSRVTMRTIRNLARVLLAHRPAIVHLYFTGFVTPFPWLARVSGARRIYFTDQSSRPEGDVTRAATTWKRWVARALTSPITAAIGISDYNARCCATHGLIAGGRVRRIYNSVDLRVPQGDGAQFRRRWAIPEDRLLIAQVSAMVPDKGIPDLIEAARVVVAQRPDAHFLMVGDGANLREYVQTVADLGLRDRFTCTGMIADPVGEGVFAAADVVCLLSRWQEGFGWVLAEAMAAERPIVATRAGAIPEVVSHGESGFLVERRDAAAAAEAMIRLLSDAGLRRSMGAAGRKLAELRFDLETNVRALIDLYGIGTSTSSRAAAAGA